MDTFQKESTVILVSSNPKLSIFSLTNKTVVACLSSPSYNYCDIPSQREGLDAVYYLAGVAPPGTYVFFVVRLYHAVLWC